MIPRANDPFHILVEVPYVYTFGNTDVFYANGSLSTQPGLNFGVSASYQSQCEETSRSSAIVKGVSVELLSQDPNAQKMCVKWNGGIDRSTFPPCMYVVVEKENLQTFSRYVAEVYKDCTLGEWAVCRQEVPIPDIVKHTQAIKNLNIKIDQVTRLIEMRVLSYTKPRN